jgi:hypothetical protein
MVRGNDSKLTESSVVDRKGPPWPGGANAKRWSLYSGAAFHGERRMDVAQTERRAPAPFPTGRRRTTTSQPRQVLAAAALIGIGIFD